ncbi:MAG: ATP-binding cassette domain-containing protein [Candidatus Marinimicrobia bacterium]|nr:ATP-binding cassette domain-containing protein [Candidatus Neomarinimicrobiota bacterium]
MSNIFNIEGLNSIISSPNGPVYVLNDITFSIPKGKTIGIVGESGSGKTQLMMAMTGTQPLTPGIVSGSVHYYDHSDISFYPDELELKNHYRVHRRVNSENYKRKNAHSFEQSVREQFSELRGTVFGIIPQDPKSFLNPYWTIEELFKEAYNKFFEIGQIKEKKLETFIHNNFEKFDLDIAVKNKYPDELSGGEAQRVMNAFVLAHKPKVVFADETTTGIDVSRQKKVISQFKLIQSENPDTTIVIISHDFAFLNHLVDTYVVMFGGFVLEAINDINKLRSRETLHPYTADLLLSLDSSNNNIQKETIDHFIDLTIKPQGCPYKDRCKVFTIGTRELQHKCESEFPPIVDHSNEQLIETKNTDWQRCWHPYLEAK